MDLATRLEHEAYFHQNSWFVTLTYNDENLPRGGSLVADHISKFVKALRKKIAPRKLRFFGVGEYGGQLGRAHYHVILFGPDFPDRRVTYEKSNWQTFSESFNKMFGSTGIKYFESDLLSKVWKKGFVQLTAVSPATMQYVAKYHVEKVTGDKAEDYYTTFVDSGELIELEPEQSRMSRNPGLGRKWIETFWREIYVQEPRGAMRSRGGAIHAPPKYYDRWCEENQPEIWAAIKADREEMGINWEQMLQQRCDTIEKCRVSKLNHGRTVPHGRSKAPITGS